MIAFSATSFNTRIEILLRQLLEEIRRDQDTLVAIWSRSLLRQRVAVDRLVNHSSCLPVR